MVTFRSNNNNNRRPPFRSNNNRRPPFRGNNEGSKFSNNDNFQRKIPGKNNHNAPKLIEKYNEMAREALANEDRVLSENYFQHADHFTRVQNEHDSLRMARTNPPPVEAINSAKTPVEVKKEEIKTIKTDEGKNIISEPEIKKIVKSSEKKQVEKKSVAS
jgi:hypothetical protein|tara:strand:- start:287 stop:766 length:480 start_codon:yes stop_codon:yes gene_type:complete